MSQTTNQNERKEHQPQTKQKDGDVYETQPNAKETGFNESLRNQKALDWLRTQFYEKEWEVHENKEEIIQKVKNGEPIIVVNYLNSSDQSIRNMVADVLKRNEFEDDSSIFVIVPSINDDTGNSSHDQNSTICIQMSTFPLEWKNKFHQVIQAAHHGVKISSKGKKFFMEGLPVEILSSRNKETSSEHRHLKEYKKKSKKNKLCQISTPDGIVQMLENSCNAITDTTADRPCCCSLKPTHYSDYSPNNEAGAMSTLISPLLAKHDVTYNPCHIPRLGKNVQESIEQLTAPQALCGIPPCRNPQAQHHRALAPYHSNCAPQHDNPYITLHHDEGYDDLHHVTVPAQYYTKPTSQYVNPCLAPSPDNPVPNLRHATASSHYYTRHTSQYINPCSASSPPKPYPDPHHSPSPALYHSNLTPQLVNPCLAPLPAKTCRDPHPTEPCLNSYASNLYTNPQQAQSYLDPQLAKPCNHANTYHTSPSLDAHPDAQLPNTDPAKTYLDPQPDDPFSNSYPANSYIRPLHAQSDLDPQPAKPCYHSNTCHTSPSQDTNPDTPCPNLVKIYPEPHLAEPCPNSRHVQVCPDPHPVSSCPRPQHAVACPKTLDTPPCPDTNPTKQNIKSQCAQPHINPQLTKPGLNVHPTKPHHVPPCPTQETKNLLQLQACQCSPEMMLDLLKLAVKGGNMNDLKIGRKKCTELSKAPELQNAPEPPCQKPPVLTILAPGNEPVRVKRRGWKSNENDEECPCRGPTAGMQIETGETKQKQICIKETKFIATIGTSTEPKTPWYKPKWNKTVCECPKAEPEPDPEIDIDELALEFYFQKGESIEEMMKKRSLETQRISGFKINKKRPKLVCEEVEYTVEDEIRYYAMMHPDLFQNVMAEQQAKIDGAEPIWRTPVITSKPEEPAVEEEGPFKGLKFKIGGKGTASKGLAGVCCFDLLQESFTTW